MGGCHVIVLMSGILAASLYYKTSSHVQLILAAMLID